LKPFGSFLLEGVLLDLFERFTRVRPEPPSARREFETPASQGRSRELELSETNKILERQIARQAQSIARLTQEIEAQARRRDEAEARYAAVCDAVPYGAWIYRADGTAELLSASFLELLDERAASAGEVPWFSFVHRGDQGRVESLWKEVIAAGSPWDCEFRIAGKDGVVRDLLSRGAPLAAPNGGPVRYAGFQMDITERTELRQELVRLKEDLEFQVACKTEQLRDANRHLVMDLADRMKAELALRDSESQLRAIYENALDSMIVLDDGRKILDANESAQHLFGIALEGMRRLRWDDLIAPERLPDLEQRWRSLPPGGTKKGEVDVRRGDGKARLVAFSLRAGILPGRHLITLRDITDHREAEESLRLLSHRLIRLQDDERRRIARELHDSTGQGLAALRMHLDALRAATPQMNPKAQEAMQAAEQTCEACTADIRTISYLLHPPLLDEVGLLPALEWYVSGFSERSGVHVTKEVKAPERPLSRDLNTTLFRIIQEALANVHKHADTKLATIRLYTEPNRLVLEIGDQGRGFDLERLQNRKAGVEGLGVGLTGMRERVRQLGGTLEIFPANPGTLIRATFPMREVNEDGQS
jgi:PAS domain S-box-containing protein